MPINCVIAPATTNKWKIKCAAGTFFNTNGIIPREYTIPPPKIHQRIAWLYFNHPGMNITPLQPIMKYSGKLIALVLPGPKIDTKVIPTIISPHITPNQIQAQSG